MSEVRPQVKAGQGREDKPPASANLPQQNSLLPLKLTLKLMNELTRGTGSTFGTTPDPREARRNRHRQRDRLRHQGCHAGSAKRGGTAKRACQSGAGSQRTNLASSG